MKFGKQVDYKPEWNCLNLGSDLLHTVSYQPATAKGHRSEDLPPLTHRPGALSLDPTGGSGPRSEGLRFHSRSRRVPPSHPRCPTSSGNLALALHNASVGIQWRKLFGLCFCRRTIAFLQGGRTVAYPTMGRSTTRCTLALNPAFSVASYRIPSLWWPFAMADYNLHRILFS